MNGGITASLRKSSIVDLWCLVLNFIFFLISSQAVLLSLFNATVEGKVILFGVIQFSSIAETLSIGRKSDPHQMKPIDYLAWRTHVAPPLAKKLWAIDGFWRDGHSTFFKDRQSTMLQWVAPSSGTHELLKQTKTTKPKLNQQITLNQKEVMKLGRGGFMIS